MASLALDKEDSQAYTASVSIRIYLVHKDLDTMQNKQTILRVSPTNPHVPYSD